MSFSAGVVSATLSGNFSPAGFMAFDAAIRKSKSAMDDAEKSHTRMSRTMAAVGKGGAMAAAGGILAVGIALTKSVSLAADFEQQLSRLKSVSSATGAQLQVLKKDAMAAGAATKFSALDAAKAQTELAKGGLKVADIHGGALTAALSLAAAGELDLSDAAATTVNAMKQFGIHGSQAGHVADALATAANSTTVDVADLGLALRQGGGVAAMAGASFDETVAAISALADASVKGADAGTSLKSFFLNIATPSKKAAEAMHGLGLNIFTASGDLKPMPALAANVRQAFSGLTKEQFLSKAGTIAGSDAARALFAIYKAGPEGMTKYLDAQKKVGSAAEVAATKQDNLRGKIENLKGSLETAGIQLGEGLLPGLTDGASKLTDTINKMSASGDLTRLGEDLGSAVNAVVAAGPQIASSLGIAGQGVKLLVDSLRLGLTGGLSSMLMPIELILRAVKATADVANKLDPFGNVVDTGGLGKLLGQFDDLRNSAKNAAGDVIGDVTSIGRAVSDFGGKSVEIKIKGDPSQVVAALQRVQSAKLSDKVMRILGKDESAAAKIKEIRALGIGPKTARILGQNADAIAKIGSVKSAITQIPASVTVQVGANIGNAIGALAQVRAAANAAGAAVGSVAGKAGKGHATGRGADGAERALVGEGTGGELVGTRDGWAWVTQPTLMDLGAGDYVIPSDPAMSGRALGLMFGMLGVPGYAKGKKPKKAAAAPKALPIPDAVTFGAVPEDELNNSKDAARDAYQKRRDRVHKLDSDIRDDRTKVSQAKGSKAKAKAREKLHADERDRHRYNDGGDGLASLADMRKKWQDLSAQAKVLHATNMEIDRLNTRQETDRTKMATASKRGDQGAWRAARGDRNSILATLRDKYAKALGLAKPGSTFAADLESKLAGVEGEIADATGEAFTQDISPADQRLLDTGMTDAERATLLGLDAAQSLAALTAGTEDDQATAGAKLGFLTNILAAVQSDPSRGGASAIRDIADQVKQARDNVASFTGAGSAGNDNQDLQAQIEQQRTQIATLTRDKQISDLGLSVFKGAGDIGMGPRITINTLHPGDPQTLAAIGNAATAGQGQQAFISSPRTNLGL